MLFAGHETGRAVSFSSALCSPVMEYSSAGQATWQECTTPPTIPFVPCIPLSNDQEHRFWRLSSGGAYDVQDGYEGRLRHPDCVVTPPILFPLFPLFPPQTEMGLEYSGWTPLAQASGAPPKPPPPTMAYKVLANWMSPKNIIRYFRYEQIFQLFTDFYRRFELWYLWLIDINRFCSKVLHKIYYSRGSQHRSKRLVVFLLYITLLALLFCGFPSSNQCIDTTNIADNWQGLKYK